MYFVKASQWMKWIYPKLVWDIPVGKGEKVIYFTFDDGPHPVATPFVLEQLRYHNAKATFFCIGRNVADHGEIYKRIIDEGHVVGNHTYNHLSGWKTKDREYINDIAKAAELVDSKLFRPPYGRITRFQARVLAEKNADNRQAFTVIMWSVLAADWDNKITGEKCYENVILNAGPGSIIVFHDSAKALERMQYALPKALAYYSKKGYEFKALPA
jgi:peptidoglycan-N-acetylglucosamine deacetylase